MNATTNSPEDVLRGAAELIRRGGWVQGVWKRRRLTLRGIRTAYCALGAVREVGLDADVYDLLDKRLGFYAAAGDLVTAWNDDPTRTLDDVLRALDPRDEEGAGQ